jgi:hypothetical protein
MENRYPDRLRFLHCRGLHSLFFIDRMRVRVRILTVMRGRIDACCRKVARAQTTMSNANVPTNATCCDSGEVFHRTEVDVALTVVSLMVFGLCSLIFIFSFIFGICRKEANLSEAEEHVPSQESAEERIRERKEFISNGLIVKEWAPDDLLVQSTGGDQDTPAPSQETAEAPQPPAPRIKSSPASCAMGSDDCDPLAREEETAGCAICLSQFKPQQLVCESNNASCQHVFHKDCMFDWLMKPNENNNTCPMCREVYLIKAV